MKIREIPRKRAVRFTFGGYFADLHRVGAAAWSGPERPSPSYVRIVRNATHGTDGENDQLRLRGIASRALVYVTVAVTVAVNTDQPAGGDLLGYQIAAGHNHPIISFPEWADDPTFYERLVDGDETA